MPAPSQGKPGFLVAVVDDEESVRKAIARLVRSAGWSAETYGCAVDFMRSLQRRRPDCVVLDLRMPVVGGLEVQSVLARTGSGVPVIVLTGDDAAESRARTLELGARACLRKPVDGSALIQAIQDATGAA